MAEIGMYLGDKVGDIKGILFACPAFAGVRLAVRSFTLRNSGEGWEGDAGGDELVAALARRYKHATHVTLSR